MRSRVVGLSMIVACAVAGAASASEWVVDGQGDCVRRWTPADLARGPAAMLNGLTMPVRQLVGGGQAGMDPPDATAAVRVPALGLIGLGTGTFEGLFVVSQGLVELLTGGYFGVVPDDVAEPSLAPMTPRFLAPPPQEPPTDPCGRKR